VHAAPAGQAHPGLGRVDRHVQELGAARQERTHVRPRLQPDHVGPEHPAQDRLPPGLRDQAPQRGIRERDVGEVQHRRVGEGAAQQPRQRVQVVVLDEHRARRRPGAHDRLGQPCVGLQVAAPGLVVRDVQVLEPAAADDVVLQHPQHLVADLPVVGVVGGGGQRDRDDVQARVGLIRRGGEQALARLLGVGRLRDAAVPGHAGAARERGQHADQTAGGRPGDPRSAIPYEVIRSAIGDDDNPGARSGQRL
jgi:hypothetical protein